MREWLVAIAVTAEKARLWMTSLVQIVKAKRCDAGFSSKLAGRLSFSVILAPGRLGRAVLSPLCPSERPASSFKGIDLPYHGSPVVSCILGRFYTEDLLAFL